MLFKAFTLDPSDNHTPVDISVVDGEGGAKTVSWKIKKHGMGPLDNATHLVNAFDIWVAGASEPVTKEVTEVAAKSDDGVEYSQELTSAQVGDADVAYLVSHCNKHGGRIAVFGL